MFQPKHVITVCLYTAKTVSVFQKRVFCYFLSFHAAFAIQTLIRTSHFHVILFMSLTPTVSHTTACETHIYEVHFALTFNVNYLLEQIFTEKSLLLICCVFFSVHLFVGHIKEKLTNWWCDGHKQRKNPLKSVENLGIGLEGCTLWVPLFFYGFMLILMRGGRVCKTG